MRTISSFPLQWLYRHCLLLAWNPSHLFVYLKNTFNDSVECLYPFEFEEQGVARLSLLYSVDFFTVALLSFFLAVNILFCLF